MPPQGKCVKRGTLVPRPLNGNTVEYSKSCHACRLFRKEVWEQAGVAHSESRAQKNRKEKKIEGWQWCNQMLKGVRLQTIR